MPWQVVVMLAQYFECSEYHRIVHLNMAVMVNVVVCILP